MEELRLRSQRYRLKPKRHRLLTNIEVRAILSIKPHNNYECFSKMGGAGTIHCERCGYKAEIISFIHGFCSCEIGRQCPRCHTFFTEYNENPEEYHVFGVPEKDCICPTCGKVVRRKEEDILKGNNESLYCPKCHSSRLSYWCKYIT